MTDRRAFLGLAGAAALLVPRLAQAQNPPPIEGVVDAVFGALKEPIWPQLAVLSTYIELMRLMPPEEGAYVKARTSYDTVRAFIAKEQQNGLLPPNSNPEKGVAAAREVYSLHRSALLAYIEKAGIAPASPAAGLIERGYLASLAFLLSVRSDAAVSARWCIWPYCS